MTKYNFGYEIQSGTTTQWARDVIPAGSHVLEFGPSIGYLTKALQEKSCKVDIVEIDQSAGASAAQFAEKALIGPEDGNVENLKWCTAFPEGSYDAIVFLDVLEHLHDPETILSHVIRYLKPDGKLYLSVPNIAHNSVVINLINNRWEYTELGLLDNTHIHFFTYHSLIELFRKLNLTVEFQSAIQKMVGDNEIRNDYSDVPMELAAALKAREYPDAYQFLFRLSQKPADNRENPEPEVLQLEKLLNTSLGAELSYRYPNEDAICQHMIKRYYPGPIFAETICLPYENGSCPEHLLVGFPMHCCVISGFMVVSAQEEPQPLSWITNGLQLENGDLVFANGNSQIDILIPPGTKKLELRWKVLYYDSAVISYLHSVVDAQQKVPHLAAEMQQLEQLLEEARAYAQSLAETAQAEQKKSAELEGLLGESRAYAQSLAETAQAEQKKSAELERLLGESRDYAQSLVATIQAEQSRSGELESLLSESRTHGQLLAETIQTEQTRGDGLQAKLDRIHNSKYWKLFKYFFK